MTKFTKFASKFLLIYNFLFIVDFRIINGKIKKSKIFFFQNLIVLISITYLKIKLSKLVEPFQDKKLYSLLENGSLLYFIFTIFFYVTYPAMMFIYLLYLRCSKQNFLLKFLRKCEIISKHANIDLDKLMTKIKKVIKFHMIFLCLGRIWFFLAYADQNLITLIYSITSELYSEIADLFMIMSFNCFIIFYNVLIENFSHQMNNQTEYLQLNILGFKENFADFLKIYKNFIKVILFKLVVFITIEVS